METVGLPLVLFRVRGTISIDREKSLISNECHNLGIMHKQKIRGEPQPHQPPGSSVLDLFVIVISGSEAGGIYKKI